MYYCTEYAYGVRSTLLNGLSVRHATAYAAACCGKVADPHPKPFTPYPYVHTYVHHYTT